MISIDLNCDMGEGMPYDADILPYVSSINIACGYHAGNEDIMKKTVKLALEHQAAIGAHPGFKDKKNFGRREKQMPAEKCYILITEQLMKLKRIADSLNASLHHVKPHGALYNMAARDPALSRTIVQAVKDFDKKLAIYGLSGSYLIREAKAIHLQTASEVFADRTYMDDGSLTPRSQPNALIENETLAVQQVLQMISRKTVTSVRQTIIPILAETICIHGDGKNAAQFAKHIRQALVAEGIVIRAN